MAHPGLCMRRGVRGCNPRVRTPLSPPDSRRASSRLGSCISLGRGRDMDEIKTRVDRRSFISHAARTGAGATLAGSVPGLLSARTAQAAAPGGQITVAIHSFLHGPLAPFLKDF